MPILAGPWNTVLLTEITAHVHGLPHPFIPGMGTCTLHQLQHECESMPLINYNDFSLSYNVTMVS